MANLNFINEQLATGGDLPYGGELAALDELVEMGITHILDARCEWSDEDLVAQHGPRIRYLHNPADDAGQRMPDSWFELGVAFALDALADPSAKVLVHCHMGINRGPSLAYAVMLASGADPVAALARIREVRPIAAVGYAEDALDWHLRRTGADRTARRAGQAELAKWRADNWIDIVRIIREIRDGERWSA